MTIPDNYTQFMEDVAADQKHGYSQQSRWGNPDYDCSSLVISALRQAGIPTTATYTGNMYQDLTKRGFSDVKNTVNLSTGSGLKRGDILLNDQHHTAVYCGGGKIVHARGQSHGSSAPGDQGTEIAVTNYYNPSYGWDHVLRYGVVSSGIVGTCAVNLYMMVPGAMGDQVKTLQALLNMRGYRGKDGYPLDCDGEFGENTEYAVAKLQRDYKFPSDTYWGTVAGKTWTVLLTGRMNG